MRAHILNSIRNVRSWIKAALVLPVLAAVSLHARPPEWIWENAKPAANEVRYFRKTFDVPPQLTGAMLTIAADDEAEVYLNGSRVMQPKGWQKPSHLDVLKHLRTGENVIAVLGRNGSGDAALLVQLELDTKQKKTVMVSDSTWLAAASEAPNWFASDFDAGNWKAAISRGKVGVEPWGDIFKVPQATPAGEITVPPGFKIELLHTSQASQGSWICLAVDDKGRLIISPQQGELPLLRFTLSRAGAVEKIEPIPAPLRNAMGLLYAFDSLYVNGQGPKGVGLYRLIDANRNDQFEEDEVHFLKKFDGTGEHGYHAVVLGPDEMIYVMNGNHTKVPEGILPTSPHKNHAEDHLLPRLWDANGHAVGVLAPGGYIARADRDGRNWELLLAGFRNAYDFDFNADGEMFTFDSDMEWDWGAPWYRPTRINHCVSGADYGWRSGTGKWPDYYPDGLPTTVDIGIGSPTGVKFGTKSRFPEKYQKALFAMDWSYGRILAVHLQPEGATYTGSYEDFVRGKPLNVTDLEFGSDGAMYFITGGRNTQSGLYRVSHAGRNVREPGKTPAQLAAERHGKQARALRRVLESFHGQKNPAAIDLAWPHLNSSDRWLRYAARIAIEWQDVALWQDRAILETSVNGGLTALLALARCSGKETQNDLLKALAKFPIDALDEEQTLAKLRVIQLSFIRQGRPESAMARLAIEKLNRQYPSQSEAINRELCQLLVYLEAPDVIEKTLALLDRAPTQEEQLHYIFCLRTVKSGWSLEQRRKYFAWFHQDRSAMQHPPGLLRWFAEAGREYGDGSSFAKFLVNIRNDAIATLTAEEHAALASLLPEDPNKNDTPPVERQFVKEWTMADIEPFLDQVSRGRSFAQGEAAFKDAQCLACHRFKNDGGSVGPDLTVVLSRFSRRDLLEAIIEPSKVISDQYQNMTIIKTDGDDITGRIMDETEDKVFVSANPLSNDRIEILKKDIATREPSPISPMPEALVNILSKEEILDLLAYIESVGKPRAANFSKK